MKIELDDRELAHMLASLRYVQSRNDPDVFGYRRKFEDMEHFQDCKPLTDAEVDELCEKLNTVGGNSEQENSP